MDWWMWPLVAWLPLSAFLAHAWDRVVSTAADPHGGGRRRLTDDRLRECGGRRARPAFPVVG
ncbi:hypothetical protein GCU56_15945 [Geodermatophilus sabuli]|uniref:Uncharacterized protein n=1 Tax=Geodermatophilus sabuli TaxID=1564158 RepID=A0A7K3W539_9ACTN|nr:hypothetical protein [Geodermatophilus sabuli]NEK59354.1 hypothetical protein [Geodermatophilus sabuli]